MLFFHAQQPKCFLLFCMWCAPKFEDFCNECLDKEHQLHDSMRFWLFRGSTFVECVIHWVVHVCPFIQFLGTEHSQFDSAFRYCFNVLPLFPPSWTRYWFIYREERDGVLVRISFAFVLCFCSRSSSGRLCSCP